MKKSSTRSKKIFFPVFLFVVMFGLISVFIPTIPREECRGLVGLGTEKNPLTQTCTTNYERLAEMRMHSSETFELSVFATVINSSLSGVATYILYKAKMKYA